MLKNSSDYNTSIRNNILGAEFIPSGSDMINIMTHSYLNINDKVNVLLQTTDLSLGTFKIVTEHSHIDITLLIQE